MSFIIIISTFMDPAKLFFHLFGKLQSSFHLGNVLWFTEEITTAISAKIMTSIKNVVQPMKNAMVFRLNLPGLYWDRY